MLSHFRFLSLNHPFKVHFSEVKTCSASWFSVFPFPKLKTRKGEKESHASTSHIFCDFCLLLLSCKRSVFYQKIEISSWMEIVEKIKLQSFLAWTLRPVLGSCTLFSEDGKLFHLPLHPAIMESHVKQNGKCFISKPNRVRL